MSHVVIPGADIVAEAKIVNQIGRNQLMFVRAVSDIAFASLASHCITVFQQCFGEVTVALRMSPTTVEP